MTEPASDRAVTVRFTARSFDRVHRYLLQDANEQVCFLFAHVVESPTRRIFLVDRVLTLDPACYLRRSRTEVVVDSRAKNAVYLRFAESPYNGLINCHSHPFDEGRVCFSEADDVDDLREMAWQYDQLPIGKHSFGQSPQVHALSMVFGQNSLDGRGYSPGQPPSLPSVEQVQVLGERLTVLSPTGAGHSSPVLSKTALETYDRQIRAFGIQGQRALSSLRVCQVGAGGIGSILTEGFVRLGVTKLTLVDPDCLDMSNLNRWQGGRPGDVGQPKVDVLAKRLGELSPNVTVVPIAAPLTAPEALMAVKDCDVLIGAVDNHLTRFVINRVSVQNLIPYIDAASIITCAPDDRIKLLTRLGVVVPGTTACLSCSQIAYYDHRALALHFYDPVTRRELERAGYVEDHPEMAAPAVMSLNMQAASLVLTELLNLVTGFAPLARYARIDCLCPSGQILRADASNFPEGPAVDCLCCGGFLGRGDSEPLPVIDKTPPVGVDRRF